MLKLYCDAHHAKTHGLCHTCQELFDYAMLRLTKCPFKQDKPTCVKCTVHCYKPEMRERVRVAMRYAGPRMLKRHPVLAVMHLIDARKQPGSRGTPAKHKR